MSDRIPTPPGATVNGCGTWCYEHYRVIGQAVNEDGRGVKVTDLRTGKTYQADDRSETRYCNMMTALQMMADDRERNARMELVEMRDERGRLRSENSRLRGENEQLRATVSDLEDRCRTLEAEVQRLRVESSEVRSENHGLRSEISQLLSEEEREAEQAALRQMDAALDQVTKLEEAGSYLCVVARWFHDNVYPRDVFVGCDGCLTDSCECDPGVRWCRHRMAAMDAWITLVGGAGPGVGDLGVIDRPGGSIVAPESAPPVATNSSSCDWCLGLLPEVPCERCGAGFSVSTQRETESSASRFHPDTQRCGSWCPCQVVYHVFEVDYGESDYYVARSEDEALKMFDASPDRDEKDDDEPLVTQLPPDKELTMFDDNGNHSKDVTKTCAEWVLCSEPGFLMGHIW